MTNRTDFDKTKRFKILNSKLDIDKIIKKHVEKQIKSKLKSLFNNEFYS